MDYDVAVIGGGVAGAAALRYLSLLNAKCALFEKEEDISSGTTKANSGIVHAGYDPEPGTLKAKLNIRGVELMKKESELLGFDYKNNGALVISLTHEDDHKLEELYNRGLVNGVKDMEIISGDDARRIEPHLSSSVTKALHLKSSSIVCPFSLTEALSENAYENGAELFFNKEVVDIAYIDSGWKIIFSDNESITASYVVNAAGLYADKLNNLVSTKKLNITPKRGCYMLFDKSTKGYINSTIFQIPTDKGKGVLVTPTVHGNLMIGPTAIFQDDKADRSTLQEDLDLIARDALKSVDSIPFKKVITSFTGLRAHEDGDDFVIGEAEGAPGFFNVAGIESPGLSASLAIGEYVASLIEKKGSFSKKADPVLRRERQIRVSELPKSELERLVASNPLYGKVVCRCELVTEGEIIDSITRPVGAKSMDGIKRRVRAGMGRCQAGFCTPRVMELLAEYTGKSIYDVSKNNENSKVITGGEND